MSSAAVVSLCFAGGGPVSAQSVAGPYLAGRAAAIQSDYPNAAQYFTQALARDPGNVSLMESAVLANLAMGFVDKAVPIAQALAAQGPRSQVADLALMAQAIKAEDYDRIINAEPQTEGIGPLIEGLLIAWAQMGQGEVAAALASFDAAAAQPGLQGFGLFQKAMALAMVGDYEGAEAIFSAENAAGAVQTRQGVMSRVAILSQLERNADAIELISSTFNGATDPELDRVIAQLQAGETIPFSHVRSVRDGFSDVFFSVAAALRNEAGPEVTLLYVQIARDLRPDNVEAMLLTAELFEEIGQFDAAIEVYKLVPADDPAYHAAELGRAMALRQSDRPDAAIEVLEQLARARGELAAVHSSLGDALRAQDRFVEAIAAYDTAIDLTKENDRSRWFLYYARGIARQLVGDWAESEADFRAALALNPDQPQVLNNLGYGLVEQRSKLDEALDMIERAVAASPDSGYIVDSLGWALYRLGRYNEAVPHMERAVELMAVDPIVNDHLGDVYWAVGRKREAEFQWHRALSFVSRDISGEVDPDRIRRKLEIGLDKVLEEEGAAPLTSVSE